MNEMIERVAKALQREAETFESPVNLYVEPESQARWGRENPGKYANDSGPDIDWDLESWKILARAAIEAMKDMTPAMIEAGTERLSDPDPAAMVFCAMVDAALCAVPAPADPGNI